MIETEAFGFVEWNQYFDQELFMFLFQWESKSIDYTVTNFRTRTVKGEK